MPILRYSNPQDPFSLISIDGVDGYLAEMYDDVPARNDNFVFRLWEETRSWESPWSRSIYFFFFRSRVIVSDTISVSPFRNGLRRKGRKVAFYKDWPDSRLLSHDSDSSQSLRIQGLARLMAANY